MSEIKYGRKRSGIKKELRDTICSWINSIEDEELQSLARRDTIVTGGSIVSMLMGDEINDFDIYFKTKETTTKIAQYYLKQAYPNYDSVGVFKVDYDKFLEYQTLLEAEPIRKDYINETPYKEDYNNWHRELDELCADNKHPKNVGVLHYTNKNCKGELEERVSCFIRSSGVFDADANKNTTSNNSVFDVEEDNTPFDSLELVCNEKKAFTPQYISSNAITLSDKIQLIVRFFGTHEEIHSNYDFCHAKGYYEYANNKLVVPPEALECMMSRTLIYNGSLYPIASIFRMKKFIERGWRISAGQMLKIMWQISELDLTDLNVVKEQLTGVDMVYLSSVVASLKSKDPTSIDSTHIGEIIDTIFDENFNG